MPIIDDQQNIDTFTTPVRFKDVPIDGEFLMDGQLWKKTGFTRARKVEWPGKGNTRPIRPQLIVKIASIEKEG